MSPRFCLSGTRSASTCARGASQHFYQFERIPSGVAILGYVAYLDTPAIFKDLGGFNSWLLDEACETNRDLVREFDGGEVLLASPPDTSNWERIETDRINMLVEGDRITWEANIFGDAIYQADNEIRLGDRSFFA